MYAVIESGGKQYRVAEGDSFLVDRLSAEQGEKVKLTPVMLRGDDVIADRDSLAKATVEATVTEHLRGPKIRVFKYKAKKGYRRRAGHRSELTRLEVTSVKAGSRTKKKSASENEAVKEDTDGS